MTLNSNFTMKLRAITLKFELKEGKYGMDILKAG